MTPKYSYRVAWSTEDESWIAISPEFGPTISGYGDTPQEAMSDLDEARQLAIDVFINSKWALPEQLTAEDRDRILQLVRLVQNMDYQTKQALMDRSNYDRMFDSLQEARKLLVPIVNSLGNLPEGYYAVSWDDDGNYGGYYVRFGGYGPTWAWDAGDDPEMIPEDAAIFINGQKRYAHEFRKEFA